MIVEVLHVGRDEADVCIIGMTHSSFEIVLDDGGEKVAWLDAVVKVTYDGSHHMVWYCVVLAHFAVQMISGLIT